LWDFIQFNIFENLSKIGIVNNAFKDELVKMARFRNRLVHVYWDIDNKYIYKIIQDNMSTFDKFIKITAEYISRQK
jgi:uncharacterized protein YutE (UPF0331/DUF86 family)